MTSLRDRLGPLPHALFEERAVKTGSPHDDAALRALLAKFELPAHPALFAFEATYGGYEIVEEGDDDARFCVGPGACLAGDWHTINDDDRKRGLVPVLYSPNDILWYLDASGRAWGYDSIEGPGSTPYARDGDMLIARVLLYGRLWDYEAKEMLDRYAGEELAKKLGVGPIPTATDELARWWGDGELLIVEPPDDEYLSGMREAPAPRTSIGSANAERLRGII